MSLLPVTFGGRRLTELEVRCLSAALELAIRVHAGELDVIAEELVNQLQQRVPLERLLAAASLLQQAGEALHPGRPRLARDQICDGGVVQEGLLALSENDLPGHQGAMNELKVRLTEAAKGGQRRKR